MGSTINIESFTSFGTLKNGLSENDMFLFRRSEALINLASSSVKGVIHGSGMKCSDFTGISTCSGEIKVLLTDIPNELRWSCDICGSEGVIKNWRKSPGYLNSVKRKIREKNLEPTILQLSPESYGHIKRLAEDKNDLSNLLDSAEEKDGGYNIHISEFDIMRLIEIIALRIEMRGKDRPALSTLRDEIISSFSRNPAL
ncbi:MAG TPA: hypothetical protein PK358_01225 [Spirochaetota bacterium]|nr:hypothetical protein [Spirochaetota bacterium]HPJ33422.1 hypothetical protein [Spirochaetota bacterium]